MAELNQVLPCLARYCPPQAGASRLPAPSFKWPATLASDPAFENPMASTDWLEWLRQEYLRRSGSPPQRADVHWLSMPELVVMHGCTQIAIHLHCPSVKVAYLYMSVPEDVKVLGDLLSGWPKLETLTISINFTDLHTTGDSQASDPNKRRKPRRSSTATPGDTSPEPPSLQ